MEARNSPGEESAEASSRRPRPAAIKDRECPYCHDLFSSSSLGRHLDQFVREDKPKAPDGKHDVDEIRRIRGGVTRRNPRNSSARRDAAHATPPAKKPRLNGPDSNFVALNRPNWLTTGVIADVNAEALASLPSVMTSQYNFEDEQRQFIVERNEGRAAKLALTELVDNIKASLARPTESSPFPFDFFAQTFPSLVLRLLPSQPSIHAPQVIPSPKSWPIDPPSQKQRSQLRQIVTQKLELHRREQLRRKRRLSEDTHSDASPSPEPEAVAEPGQYDFIAYGAHLEAAFEAYMSLSNSEQTKLWHLSALRAYAEEQTAHKETYKRLEKAEQMLAHQVAQVKKLSSIQQPREYLLNPPTATPLPTASAEAIVAGMMGRSSGDDSAPSLNVDALIAKWKPAVQDNRGFQKSFMSVFEAAARTVAAGRSEANDGQQGHDDMNGDEAEENVDDSEAQIGNWPANGTRHEAEGNDGHEDQGAIVSAESAGQSSTAPAAKVSAAASRSVAQDALHPSLRGATGKEPATRDHGDFGAEGLLERLSAMGSANAASSSSGAASLRRRGKK